MKAPAIGNKSVLVTGCSSGIGRAAAELLRSKGWRVFPTARKPEDLDSLKAAGFDAIELDVTSSESIAAAVEAVLEKTGGQLGAVVNNAGFGMPGAIEDLTRDAHVLRTGSVGQQSHVTDLHESFRQDVQEESTDELDG